MLFDLKGKRKRTVQVIYVLLALSFVVGFLIFYVGSGTDTGGSVIDALGGGGGGGSSLEDQAGKAAEKAAKSPTSEAAQLNVARTQFAVATAGENYNQQTGQYTEKAAGPARKATAAWERYLALKPATPNPNVAIQMVRLYAFALNQPKQAAETQRIVVETRPTAQASFQLAQFEYLAGNTREGDLAAQQAVSRAPKDQRKQIEKQLEDFKKQAASQAAAGGSGSSGQP